MLQAAFAGTLWAGAARGVAARRLRGVGELGLPRRRTPARPPRHARQRRANRK